MKVALRVTLRCGVADTHHVTTAPRATQDIYHGRRGDTGYNITCAIGAVSNSKAS
jgi:hypothetical protein